MCQFVTHSVYNCKNNSLLGAGGRQCRPRAYNDERARRSNFNLYLALLAFARLMVFPIGYGYTRNVRTTKRLAFVVVGHLLRSTILYTIRDRKKAYKCRPLFTF